MKKYARVFRYIADYKGRVLLYFLFTVLSIAFSIISVGMLMPFLQLIFGGDTGGAGNLVKDSSNPVVKYVRDFLISNIRKNGSGVEGKLTTLGLICVFIIISIFLKN